MRSVMSDRVYTCRRWAAYGFTLIELMVVLVIVAILVVVGVPMITEFIADQRVRTVTSDIVADIAFARAKAVEQSRRVYMERTGATWANGWRIFVDLNDSNSYDANEEVKIFNGYPAGSMYLCSTVADFANNVIFRPDGRVVRSAVPAPGANDGIYVVDLMNDGVLANNKIRGILFGTSGRATTVLLNGTGAPC
jgi:prepilin-type N-terminal cleavage/methylation domain-containing protein